MRKLAQSGKHPLVEGDHNIDCKIDGFGPMKLKSEFVKRTRLAVSPDKETDA